jgi:hypothetical protein
VNGIGQTDIVYIGTNRKPFTGSIPFHKSTRKIANKSSVQKAAKGFLQITNIMLNKGRFLGFVIFKGSLKGIVARCQKIKYHGFLFFTKFISKIKEFF